MEILQARNQNKREQKGIRIKYEYLREFYSDFLSWKFMKSQKNL